MDAVTAGDVVAFWREAGADRWFTKDDAFDAAIRTRFLPAHEAAARGDRMDWQSSPNGALALVLLLDQFPRNLFRGSPRAYATDALACSVADRALARGFHRRHDSAVDGQSVADRALARGFHTEVDSDLAAFFFVPFMHSENLADQERCVALYEAAGNTDGLKWAREHRDIVARFGRFPHRNPVLGRETTEEERAFLEDGGFSG